MDQSTKVQDLPVHGLLRVSSFDTELQPISIILRETRPQVLTTSRTSFRNSPPQGLLYSYPATTTMGTCRYTLGTPSALTPAGRMRFKRVAAMRVSASRWEAKTSRNGGRPTQCCVWLREYVFSH